MANGVYPTEGSSKFLHLKNLDKGHKCNKYDKYDKTGGAKEITITKIARFPAVMRDAGRKKATQ